MPRTFRWFALLAALSFPASAFAQATDSLPADSASPFAAPAAGPVPAAVPPAPAAPPSGGVRVLVEPSGIVEERARVAQLRGDAPLDGVLLRSASSRMPWRAGGAPAALLVPRVEAVWNRDIPWSVNDGAMWAGRGVSARLSAGVEMAMGPLRLIAAPEVVRDGNAPFRGLLPEAWDTAQVSSFIPPWQTGQHSVDLPYRMGDGAETRLEPGESSLMLRVGAVEAGVGTESQWWGPGVRNAIVLSTQAGGFPHATLRTSRPLATPLGPVEGRWLLGRLSSSAWDTASVGRHRSLSGAALVLSPTATLSVGAARVVYAPLAGGESGAGAAADVFTRWSGAGDSAAAHPFEQILSLFGRWVSPGDGAEVYAEWARHRLPGSLADFVERPEHTQGFTLGAAWLRPAGPGAVRLSGEATYLEKSSTYRQLPTGSWYAGRAVPQGYTHRGQVLGASIGPGASGQWAAVDYVAPAGQVGLSLTRVRWANDAYYDKPGGHNRYRAHDVSVLGALRAGVAAGPLWLEAEWQAGRRYNFFFQNEAVSWETRDQSVSPFNHTLRLRVSGAPPRLKLR